MQVSNPAVSSLAALEVLIGEATVSVANIMAIAIERLHVTSQVQVVVYGLGLTVLLYGTLAYLRMKLFLKTKLTDAE